MPISIGAKPCSAWSDVGEVAALADLQTEVNRRRTERLVFGEMFGGPLPPPSRRLRVKHYTQRKTMRLREKIARRIAPWLEDG